MLSFAMCSTGISRLNWYSVIDARLSKELAKLFSDLGTCLKSQQGNLDFKARMSCRYSATHSSLVAY